MALAVTSIDLCLDENGENHHTDDYENNFVLRRGASFSLKINHEGFDENTNEFYFELRTGDQVTEIKEKAQQDDEFSFQITSKTDTCVSVSVFVPVNALVSKYQLVFVNSFEGATKEYANTVYILFNPWNKADDTYMEDEDLKKEYVLSDSGEVYWSNYTAKPWNFAQFTTTALECTFLLLEKAASPDLRDAAHKVVRHMSAMSSSEDDNGLLVGLWPSSKEKEPYADGKKPWEWTGSLAVFKQYLETGKSVKYGQCWVFSGLFTSMMRCLGIPCRSVTNYHSAVDKNGNCLSESSWTHNWNEKREENDNFIWNFHVWNDVWIARPDLPAGYGGWQAVDGCPQMLSDGVHRCGPAPLAAIKEGKVDLPYDTKFMFASVNADEVTYKYNTDDVKKVYSVSEDNVGWYILTQIPNKSGWSDVIGDYKYTEYTMEERAVVMKVLRNMDAPLVQNNRNEITFAPVVPKVASYDDTIKVKLRATNKSANDLTVKVTMVPHIISYNGVMLKDLEKQTKEGKACRMGDETTFKFNFNVGESLRKEFMHENVTIRFSLFAKVKETKQTFAKQCYLDVERTSEALKVELVDNAEGKVKSKDTMKVKITLPKVSGIDKFTECSIAIDSPLVDNDNIEVNDSEITDGFLERSFQVKDIKKERITSFNVIFSSKEISGVHGSVRVIASK